MDSLENNSRNYGAASRPPRQEDRDDTSLFSDMTYAAPRRTPNNGRPSYSAAGTRSTAQKNTAGNYTNNQRPRPSSPRPGSSHREAPVYTEISWDQLLNANRTPAAPQSGGQNPPVQPQYNAPQPQNTPIQPRYEVPQRRTGSPYFGGFEQERGELFQPGKGPREGNAPAADTNANSDGTVRPSVYIPRQTQKPYEQVPRQNTPRQTTPLQSIRETAYRQAARNRANQPSPPPQRPGTPAPAKRASGAGVPPSGGSHVTRTPRPRGRIHPIFYAGGALLLALAVFLLARLAGGSSNKPAATGRPGQTAVVSVTPVPEPTDLPETTPEATAAPTPEPTPTPSGPKAKQLGELIVPADWGATVPERKKAVYDSFFDRSIMIGNSLTEGFFMWAGMEKNMEFVYGTGATVSNAVGGMDLAKITLNASDYYTDIYLMFGLNEIGTDVNSFVQSYKRLVDFIREHQTKANIYIISVTPVTRQVDEDPNEVQSMTRIRNFNAALQEFCLDQNCWYLDIYNLLLDKNGYLSGDYAFVGDGKHFEKSGYVAWANYMKTHYVDEGLLTE